MSSLYNFKNFLNTKAMDNSFKNSKEMLDLKEDPVQDDNTFK